MGVGLSDALASLVDPEGPLAASAFLTDGPIIPPAACDAIVLESESYALLRNGWTTKRHYSVPTTDIPVCELEGALGTINACLRLTLFPLIGEPCSAAASTHAHTHAHTHTHTHAYAHAHTHTHTHARTHAHMHTRTHARTHAHTHAHMHTHTHARAHACTHAQTHAYAQHSGVTL